MKTDDNSLTIRIDNHDAYFEQTWILSISDYLYIDHQSIAIHKSFESTRCERFIPFTEIKGVIINYIIDKEGLQQYDDIVLRFNNNNNITVNLNKSNFIENELHPFVRELTHRIVNGNININKKEINV